MGGRIDRGVLKEGVPAKEVLALAMRVAARTGAGGCNGKDPWWWRRWRLPFQP